MAAAPTRRRFTVDEYYKMAKAGILREDDRVELIEGEIFTMSPIGSRHAACVTNLTNVFVLGVGARAIVRVQNPIRLSRRSEPQPDVALLRPREDRYTRSHPGPEDVLLVMEVAETSLAYDRRKLSRYAEAGIPEAWLFNLVAGQVEVHREPVDGRYRQVQVLGRDAVLSPLAFPDLSMPVNDVLP
jgi:Uma2 family endonuclease